MTLQLYLNGTLSVETHLPEDDFADTADYSWENNVKFREEKLNGHLAEMINAYCTKILKARHWEIVLVAKSKMNDQKLKLLI